MGKIAAASSGNRVVVTSNPFTVRDKGAYNYICSVDDANEIRESNEANNAFSKYLSVGEYVYDAALTNFSFEALPAYPFANDGKMMAPHILRAMVDNGRQYNTTPQVIGTPIKAETAKTITSMLSRSLEEESSDALIPGYRVAGKTGTAEIPGPTGYSSDVTNASFAGWGPIDDPKFLVYIWLEKPRTSIWGSVVAAPVFSDVVKSLVVLMNIPPDSVREGMGSQ
jgi:hypothetical protein